MGSIQAAFAFLGGDVTSENYATVSGGKQSPMDKKENECVFQVTLPSRREKAGVHNSLYLIR